MKFLASVQGIVIVNIAMDLFKNITMSSKPFLQNKQIFKIEQNECINQLIIEMLNVQWTKNGNALNKKGTLVKST